MRVLIVLLIIKMTRKSRLKHQLTVIAVKAQMEMQLLLLTANRPSLDWQWPNLKIICITIIFEFGCNAAKHIYRASWTCTRCDVLDNAWENELYIRQQFSNKEAVLFAVKN